MNVIKSYNFKKSIFSSRAKFNEGDMFDADYLNFMIRLFFKRIFLLNKLKIKFNLICKQILGGKKVTSYMVSLNKRIHKCILVIKNCYSYFDLYLQKQRLLLV